MENMLNGYLIAENFKGSKRNKNEEVYCICRSTDSSRFMICCDKCNEWFHGDCIGVSQTFAEEIAFFYCEACKMINPSLNIVFQPFLKANKTETVCTKRRLRSNASCKVSSTKETADHLRDKKKSNVKFQAGIEEDLRKIYESMDNTRLFGISPDNPSQSESNESVAENDPESSEFTYPYALGFPYDGVQCRKAKIIACSHIMSERKSSKKRRTKRVKKRPPKGKTKQCYGPQCTNAVKRKSKYCSDDCAHQLALRRLKVILPEKLHEWQSSPCAANEISAQKLIGIRQKQQAIRLEITEIDERIAELEELVEESKKTPLDECEDGDKDNSSIYCKICGVEISTRLAVKHMENCYRKYDSTVCESTDQTDDKCWNIFCNFDMGDNTYCKKLRVLCSLHFKDFRNEEEVCGFPHRKTSKECPRKFCSQKKKNCTLHSQWEVFFRAELDLDKLRLLFKLGDLQKKEIATKKEMANRGNVLGLMLHTTVEH